jgi:hypothetical protein
MGHLPEQGKTAVTDHSDQKCIEELFEVAISQPEADRERFVAKPAGDDTALARDGLGFGFTQWRRRFDPQCLSALKWLA